MAERVRLQDRAQTLSFPLTNVSSILGAARAASSLVRDGIEQVTGAVSFADVLHAAPESAELATVEIADQIQEVARRRLSEAGIPGSEEIQLDVGPDGSLRVANRHERAAQIEALLSGDHELADLARHLHQSGQNRIVI